MGRALSATEAAIVRGRLALLYRLDEHAMLLDSNEPYGPREPAPLAHVCLGLGSVVYGLRSGLPAEVASGLRVALDELSPLSDLDDRSASDRIWASVRTVPMVATMRSGPVYCFPETVPPSPNAVLVDQSNSELLLATDPGLVGALPSVQPCFARIVDGKAASICHTVRASGLQREAGVSTLQECRRRGYGSEVVAAWAREVIRRGQVPLYSTDWHNRGSIGIAERLRLALVAVDLEIE